MEIFSVRGELTLADPIDPAGSGLLLAVSDATGTRLSRRDATRQHRMARRPGGRALDLQRPSGDGAKWDHPRQSSARRSRRPGVFVFRIDARRPLAARSP